MSRSTDDIRPDDAPRSARRRIRQPWLVGLGTLVFIAATAGAFFIGRMTVQPTVVSDAESTILVFATAEMRNVDSRQTFSGTMNDGETFDVVMDSASSPAVITRTGPNPGDTYSAGSLVAAVSGVPIFGLHGPLPLYRDLVIGDTGDDVTALQTSLVEAGADINITGKVSAGTVDAVHDLFDTADFDPPEAEVIPFRQLISLPLAQGSVVSTQPVGTAVDSSTPLIVLRTSANYVSFRADVVVAATLSVGQQITVQGSDGHEYPVTVASIGEFQDGSDGKVSGHDVQLVSQEEGFLSIPSGTTVTVLGPGNADESLAVPLIAIRQDNQGSYVDRASSDASSQYSRVPVSVTSSGGGWAALAEGDLKPGDRVLVS